MGGSVAVSRELPELLLREPRLTLAVAESVTAGHVQSRVAAVSGASGFFLGGVTAYTNKVNCVSAQVAEEMALGVCALFGADVGVATTGYAEPSPADGVAVPMAWWAVAGRGARGKFSVRHGRVECPRASRVVAQTIVADAALAELVAWLRWLRASGG
jgi:nicotinamide-nucleotide amidase